MEGFWDADCDGLSSLVAAVLYHCAGRTVAAESMKKARRASTASMLVASRALSTQSFNDILIFCLLFGHCYDIAAYV